ncbi:hypothetical protein V6N12_069449 [Hibiscus sabdariffa]|uniref:Uncharacterized protein n=1 Tax=Hibiscus sabdariffa TaxID=183260 RepID=A0ABR2FDW2_9ROSI
MMSESRVRSSFGRRLERLGRPGLGYRNCLTIAVRTWNEVHGADGNGGCNVCAYFFLFLQVFARWGVLLDRIEVSSKGVLKGIWKAWGCITIASGKNEGEMDANGYNARKHRVRK